MANKFWSSAPPKSAEPLTFAKIQAAVAKMKNMVEPDPVIVMHPIEYLLAKRKLHPFFTWPLPRGWRQMHEQTRADGYGWGINGYE